MNQSYSWFDWESLCWAVRVICLEHVFPSRKLRPAHSDPIAVTAVSYLLCAIHKIGLDSALQVFFILQGRNRQGIHCGYVDMSVHSVQRLNTNPKQNSRCDPSRE